MDELFAASKKHKLAASREAVAAGVQALESSLVPGLKIDIEAMRAVDWVALCLDTSGAAARLVLLKTHLPRADLTRIVQCNPGLLLQDAATLEDNARQVKHLLADAKDADALLTALPSLLDPRVLLSVLVSVRKWYHGRRDPIEVLEADPDLVLRAQVRLRVCRRRRVCVVPCTQSGMVRGGEGW